MLVGVCVCVCVCMYVCMYVYIYISMRIILRPPDTLYEGSMFCLQGWELTTH